MCWHFFQNVLVGNSDRNSDQNQFNFLDFDGKRPWHTAKIPA
jgi:hypothetical protein